MDLGLGNYATVRNFVLTAGMAASSDTQYDSVLQIIARGVAERFEVYCNRKFSWNPGDVHDFPANRSHYYLPRYPVMNVASLMLRATAQDPWQDVTSAIVQQDYKIGLIDFYVILADEMSLLRAIYSGGFFYNPLEPTDDGYDAANALTTQAATWTGQTNVITLSEANALVLEGMCVRGTGIAAKTVIVSVAGTVVTLSQYTTADGSGGETLSFTPPGIPAGLRQAWLFQILHEFQSKDRLLPEGLGDTKGGRYRPQLFEQMVILPEVQNTLDQFRRYQMV